MKILMTCDAVGGVWQYATDLARALSAQDVHVVLAVLGPNSGQPGLEPGSSLGTSDGFQRGAPGLERTWMPAQGRHDGGGKVEVIHTDLPLDWLATGADEVHQAGRAIAALAAEHAVDLIHLNSPALAASGPFRAPVVAGAHGCVGTWFAARGEAVPADLAWHEGLTRAGLHAADAIVVPSASYAAAVRRHYGLSANPLVVHNGRAVAASPTVAAADHVLTAGRLWDEVKNTALLDATAALLPVQFRAAGPTKAPHGETVATRHLRLLGTLDAATLAAEYAARPIFVSAARFEPFGLAVLEAAQAGCPLVLSGIETFRELWTGAALLVADDDPAAYAAAIERIRTEPDLREQLGGAARLRAARYTPEAMAAGTLAIYRHLLATPQRVAA